MQALGADFYACSPYKFFGPHLGAVVADPALLRTLHPGKLRPSTDEVPERFELGTLPYELLAGTTAAVDFIADLAGTQGIAGQGSRRERVLASMAAVEAYEEQLFGRLVDGLSAIDGVQLHGRAVRRTPTVLFSVRDVPASAVHQHLSTLGVNAPAGSFYAIEAAERMGLAGGAVRAGLAPYTSDEDVDRLLAGVCAI